MNSTQKYPKSMIMFHSLLAVLMIVTIVLAWSMNRENGLMFWHKSFGVLVLVFGVLRIINRMRNMANIPPSVNHGALHLVEKAVHGILMLTMLGLPIVGWLASNAKGYPVSVFGLFDLPNLISKNEGLAEQLGEMHEAGAAVFMLMLILHVVGAVYHKIKTREDVISRITPW